MMISLHTNFDLGVVKLATVRTETDIFYWQSDVVNFFNWSYSSPKFIIINAQT